MKIAFGILLLIHGIIHQIGFVKAFYSTEITMPVLGVPKLIGALWLLNFITFIVTSISFCNNNNWFYLAFIAVCISQILIISLWKDAKFGTIANIIILLVSLSAFGNFKFNQRVENEAMAILNHTSAPNTDIITEKQIQNLPEIVQKWLRNSGAIGKPNVTSVRLKQKGQMKTKPNNKWTSFTAKQYFNIKIPAFIWTTKVTKNSIIHMVGRDKLLHNKGEMIIKLAGLIPVVNEAGNEKINQGTILRFLSEISWFPSAALNDYITWEAIDSNSAKAIITIDNKSISGIFKFNNEGDILTFETDRYFGGNDHAKLEKWVINMMDYKIFNGYKIPYKCHVTWKLKEGEFNWLNLEITDLEYNVLKPYKSHYETR